MRCGHPRLHRDSADHQRCERAAADAGLYALAGPCRAAADGAGRRFELSTDAPQSVTIALAQTPVGPDVSRNLRHITAMMAKAKAAGASLVELTEDEVAD